MNRFYRSRHGRWRSLRDTPLPLRSGRDDYRTQSMNPQRALMVRQGSPLCVAMGLPDAGPVATAVGGPVFACDVCAGTDSCVGTFESLRATYHEVPCTYILRSEGIRTL